LVAGGFAVLAIAVMIPTLPWLAAQSGSGEESLNRYLDGGRLLLDRTLAALESQFGFLQRMKFQAEMGRKATELGETFVQKELAATLLGAALWVPSLLLAPFFTFFFLRDGGRFVKMLGSAVPNAFFERTIYMVDHVRNTAREYFRGLLKLTVIDTVCLAFGLWVIGVPGAFALGLIAAILAWIPFVGSVIGCIVVVLVAATDLPGEPWVVYAAIALFVLVRLLDDFVFTPLTVGRSIQMHPLPTVLMIFIGGAVAGVPGLILALPLTAVVSAVAGTIGGIVNDPRLRARHTFAKALRAQRINADLRL
jgi:predicted PurR-regulated permease PerM